MRTIPAGEFKAKCLALMDEVEATGEAIVVTKRGKPVARLCAMQRSDTADGNHSIFGFMKGHGAASVDLVAPIVPPEEWDLLREDQFGSTELEPDEPVRR